MTVDEILSALPTIDYEEAVRLRDGVQKNLLGRPGKPTISMVTSGGRVLYRDEEAELGQPSTYRSRETVKARRLSVPYTFRSIDGHDITASPGDYLVEDGEETRAVPGDEFDARYERWDDR